MRPKAGLVIHFGAGGDPVAQVHIRQFELPCLLDLPQHVVVAIAGVGVRLVKGVDGRDAVFEHIHNGDHFEGASFSVLQALAELDQVRIHAALQ